MALGLPVAGFAAAAMLAVGGAASPAPVGQALLVALGAVAVALAAVLFDRAGGCAEARIAAFERLALRDPLTDLLNRRGLTDRLADALAPGADGAPGEAAALHIDLDHFKAVNDTLGHEAGDHVLVVAAERMHTIVAAHASSEAPDSGEVCRIGGDEFCVILTGAAVAAAMPVAAEIVASLREPIDWQGKTCRIGASIGIAHGGGVTGVDDPERLLTDADLATYTAKAEGRGRYALFDTGLREEMEREAKLVEALTEALSARRLELWFQPVVTLDAESVVAAEALLRWRDPAFGDVGPETLIGVAERHSLLDQLHAEILRLFAGTLGQWHASGVALPLITLNLSSLELRFPTVISDLVAALADA
ncbi:MAG: diguanylate cyclase, partial [Pseudomonadota bacterium]